jgi:hypothetical protein
MLSTTVRMRLSADAADASRSGDASDSATAKLRCERESCSTAFQQSLRRAAHGSPHLVREYKIAVHDARAVPVAVFLT